MTLGNLLIGALDREPDVPSRDYANAVVAARTLSRMPDLAREWAVIILRELREPDGLQLREPTADELAEWRARWEAEAAAIAHKCGWCPNPSSRRMQVTDNVTGRTNEAHACSEHRGSLVEWAVSR
jgi:hypothetical protein